MQKYHSILFISLQNLTVEITQLFIYKHIQLYLHTYIANLTSLFIISQMVTSVFIRPTWDPPAASAGTAPRLQQIQTQEEDSGNLGRIFIPQRFMRLWRLLGFTCRHKHQQIHIICCRHWSECDGGPDQIQIDAIQNTQNEPQMQNNKHIRDSKDPFKKTQNNNQKAVITLCSIFAVCKNESKSA